MLVTGMRPSELMGLKWPDVDLKKGEVQVRRVLVRDPDGWYLRPPKTKRGTRTIPIPPAMVNTLSAWKKSQAEERMKAGPAWVKNKKADGLVFTTATGEPLERRNLANRDFMKVLRAAGLVETIEPKRKGEKTRYKGLVRLYDLRHTCATLMLAAGVNPKVASERLGHASVVITLDTYSHVLPTMQADATEKIAGVLYGGAK